jgi:hypothetical protein
MGLSPRIKNGMPLQRLLPLPEFRITVEKGFRFLVRRGPEAGPGNGTL